MLQCLGTSFHSFELWIINYLSTLDQFNDSMKKAQIFFIWNLLFIHSRPKLPPFVALNFQRGNIKDVNLRRDAFSRKFYLLHKVDSNEFEIFSWKSTSNQIQLTSKSEQFSFPSSAKKFVSESFLIWLTDSIHRQPLDTDWTALNSWISSLNYSCLNRWTMRDSNGSYFDEDCCWSSE